MGYTSSGTRHAPGGVVTAIAHVLSWGLSPVLMPTYGIILIFALSMLSFAPLRARLIIISVVFALTCLLPCIVIMLLIKYGNVKDAELTRRTDRLVPYLLICLCLSVCGIYLFNTGLPRWVAYFYMGAAVAGAINLVVNFWWKISAHGAGIGGFIAIIMIMNRYGLPHYNLWGWCVAAVLAAGFLGMARVWLGRHTPMQTVMGEIVGLFSVLSMELLLPE